MEKTVEPTNKEVDGSNQIFQIFIKLSFKINNKLQFWEGIRKRFHSDVRMRCEVES